MVAPTFPPMSRLARLVRLAGCLALAGIACAQDRLLTTALEVRSLTPDEAETGLPVRLRGVVVFIESQSAIFIQDETSTTFFRLATPPLPRVGDEIELTSTTRMGQYLPGLADSRFTVLGRRELPAGIAVDWDDLHFGRYHYQRVTVEGVVRSVLPTGEGRSQLRLAMGTRLIEVRVGAHPQPLSLVDHRVRLTGLAVGQINLLRRQLVQPYLRVNDWSEVQVLAAAPPPERIPPLSAADLLAFSTRGDPERRVRVEGVVTAVFDGDQAFLEQGSMAFSVRLGRSAGANPPAPLAPGDRVDLAGFPSMERFSAAVVDATILRREPGEPPAPHDVDSIDDLYGKPGDQRPGRHDGQLVRLTATIREAFRSEDGTTLLLQGAKRTANARLPEGAEPPPAGSKVRLTAVCQVETAVAGSTFQSRPGVISLRAASAEDLEVLSTPPWWTPRRLSGVLAILGGLTLLAGLWIAILRRQVIRQTSALRHRIEAEAALEERQRIAREFHDTLEQELAGVSLRLDALATREIDDKGRSLIAASRSLVSRIQSETRDLISDLRDPAESAGDLAAALAGVAARHASDHGSDVTLEPTAPLPTLAAAVVHDLRMIARESVTNALKHGRASRVVLRAVAHGNQLTVEISDNGCGFDPAATTGRRGHFGCSGMRERGRKIGADISWHSAPLQGSTVRVTLPLPPPATERNDGPPASPAPRENASTAQPAYRHA